MDTCEFKDYTQLIHGSEIPSYIDGSLVTAIAPKAFYGCRGLTQVILPPDIEKIGDYAFAECRELERMHFSRDTEVIGDYAFYNCMGLKEISLDENVCTIGYGAFKNCTELHHITLKVVSGKKNCLNAILQDEFQEVDVDLIYMSEDGQAVSEARLVFTDYQYEYVPEIEARQFNWETYGSGDSYRISIRDRDIDYLKYDSVFPLAVVEDEFSTLLKIVSGRLGWPHKLSDEARKRYEDYLRQHMAEVLKYAVSAAGKAADDIGGRGGRMMRLWSYVMEHKLLNQEDVTLALDLCRQFSRPELAALVMSAYGQADGVRKTDIKERFLL